MKKLNLLFVALALMLTSCFSDKDDILSDEFNTSGNIVGLWAMQTVTYTSAFTANLGTLPIQGTVEGTSYDENYTLNFTENPNEVVSDGNFSMNVTAVAMGLVFPQNVENFEFPNNGVWTRTGNQLTITDGVQTREATIIELTSTSLKLKFSPENFDIQQYIASGMVSNIVLYEDIIVPFTRM